MKAVLYAAKSTEDTKGSIPDQLADGRRLGEQRGLEVGSEHQDEAASAFHGNRGPGLAAAMAECERLSGEDGGCALIVQHSDRLARGDAKQARHLIEIVLWALKSNVELLSVQDPEILAGGDMALLLGAIGGMRNHQDSKRKSLAVKDGNRRRVQRGLHHGRSPYGYRSKEKELVVEPAEAIVVARIFREFAEEGLSQREIARRLNRVGVRAQRGEWTQGTVSKVLSNPVYAGKLRFHGETLDAKHKPIVDKDLWQRAEQLREANARTHRGRAPTANHLLAGGVLRCGRCGASMYAQTRPQRGKGVTWEAYSCSRRAKEGLDACDQPPVKRKPIDEAVWRFVTETALDLEATKRAITEHGKAQIAEVAALRDQADREVAKVQQARTKIEADYLHGALSAADYQRFSERLSTEEEAATASMTALRARHDTLTAEVEEIDVEEALLAELSAIRAEILGQAREPKHAGAQALRTSLRRLFSGFELVPANSFGVGQVKGIVWPQDRSIVVPGYLLIPHVQPEAIDREAWAFRREPLPLRGSEDKTFDR